MTIAKGREHKIVPNKVRDDKADTIVINLIVLAADCYGTLGHPNVAIRGYLYPGGRLRAETRGHISKTVSELGLAFQP